MVAAGLTARLGITGRAAVWQERGTAGCAQQLSLLSLRKKRPRTKSHLAEPVYFAGSALAFLAQSSQQTMSSSPPTFTLMPASLMSQSQLGARFPNHTHEALWRRV